MGLSLSFTRGHPFGWVRESAATKVLAVLVAATVGISIALAQAGAALVTDAAPLGIVSFEFVSNAAGADAMLASWSAHARQQAMLVLGLDSLYLVLYPTAISLACTRVAMRPGSGSSVRRLGFGLAWGVLLAAPFDAVENFALIRLVADGPADSWAQLALACAIPKFALVFLGLTYAAMGYLASLTRERRRSRA